MEPTLFEVWVFFEILAVDRISKCVRYNGLSLV
jgi:hypothetical protein